MNHRLSILFACLLPVGLGVCFHFWVVAWGGDFLVGADGFLRLVRVAELAGTWNWFDQIVERINAPYGMSLHWTRPYDLLLLASAGLLTPFIGFDQGLYWTGIWVSPALHLCTLVALFWATAPILGVRQRFLALVAALGQVGIIAYAVPGRADHHMVILLIFVISLGLTLRILMRPRDTRLALAGGAVLALGLWLSVEFLLTLVLTLAALGLQWVRHGGLARRNLWHSLGLGLVTLLALLADQPPGTYLSEEFDRISVVHLLLAALAVGLWGALLLIERRRPQWAQLAPRTALLGIGGMLAAGLMFIVYPKFFGGPGVDIDPGLRPAFHDQINELKPLLPTDSETLAKFLTFLGPTVLATPFLIYLLWRERRGATWEGWLYIGLMTALYLPLALAMVRFAPYACILAAIPLAELLSRLMAPLNRLISLGLVRAALRFGLVCSFVLGYAVAGSAMNLAGPKEARPACDLTGIAAELNDPQGWGAQSRILLAYKDRAAELLYRTRHAVITAPYHRNTQGILDADRIFRSNDESVSHHMIQQRGASLILLCADENAQETKLFGDETFIRGLIKGEVPAWLRRVDTKPDETGNYLLFEVLR